MRLDLGPIVLGGNVLGWTVDQTAAFRLLDAFVDHGGRAIDTADVYPAWAPGCEGGESEQILGAWMASRGNRERVHVATKVAKWDRQPGLSAANLRAAVEGSLRRLGTDYIDLYYAHEDDLSVEMGEYVEAFDALVREGKVRSLGASNFKPERLRAAVAYARERGLTGFTVSQDHWNLVEREIEDELVPVLAEEGLTELPYWSLASGFLTGKYRPGAAVDSARAGSAGQYLEQPANLRLLAQLDALAEAHGASVAGVALSWLRAQPVVGAPIASARTLEQLPALFEQVPLTAEELASLSAITARPA
ncbi:MAG: aldo/keto reductase [Alphaproteobacteria bacterium]|nr:aldo/keto reductase [Alphaproteobacteria bacterium]